jgi:hypothetical protein
MIPETWLYIVCGGLIITNAITLWDCLALNRSNRSLHFESMKLRTDIYAAEHDASELRAALDRSEAKATELAQHLSGK